LTHPVRVRLFVIAVAAAVLAGVVARVARTEDISAIASSPVAAALITFFAVIVIGWVVVATTRRALRRLVDATREVAHDRERHVPVPDGAPDDEVRQIAEWINFLIDNANKSRDSLAHERVLLAAVADGLTQGVIALDGEHRIELLNDAARRMLGVTSSLVGESLLEFVRVPELRRVVESSEAGSAEIQLPSGARGLVRVARKWGGEGRVLLLEDVTTMRRLETVRRDFVANVSHELRTPVAVIRANAETLIAGAKDDPAMASRLIDGLHRNAERLARILADLLDLSRLDAGQYRLDLAPVPVKLVTEQSLSAVEPQAAARGVTVSVSVPDNLLVRADPKALDQILVNLIDNAVKYTHAAGGHVWVEATDDGTDVRIEVRDDGPGIAAKHRERVFERFYRADPSRSREAGGTGLGLSIVKHLVESMGGQVGVEPNEPNGSVFWLRLPRASESDVGRGRRRPPASVPASA
jgi:two-component system phosphate regulon sensor histidine kinase PhoR